MKLRFSKFVFRVFMDEGEKGLLFTLPLPKDTSRISLNDSLLACCWGGFGFVSGLHCVILESLKMIPTAAIYGT